MPNVMAAPPNIGGALCSTPQSLADEIFGNRKLVPGLSCDVVCMILRLVRFMNTDLWQTDRQTDRQTEWQTARYTNTAYTALAWRRAVKTN